MNSKEHEPKNVEQTAEIARGAHERSRELAEKLKQNPERYSENEAHNNAEQARHEALQEALFSKEQGKEKRTHQADRHNSSPLITKHDRDASYKQTMDRVQQELSPGARLFSKLIHRPGIEKTSEFLGNTVARPDAILAGGIASFVVVLALYSYARYAGFSLSGFETIGAFLVGWLIGLLYDFFKTMFTGKK
jgi:hypothetical protein